MQNAPTILFSHGQESGPWGTKIKVMAEAARAHGLSVDSIDYRGIEAPGDRVAKLVAACAELSEPKVLVGSSMGGYVSAAAAAASGARGLFLLAPAFFIPGFPDFEPPAVPTEIVHGWHDDVVPPENSIRYAQASAAALHLVDGDHRLTANIDEIVVYLLRFVDRVSWEDRSRPSAC